MDLLPERTTPELHYLETRWGVLVGRGLAADTLGDVLPRYGAARYRGRSRSSSRRRRSMFDRRTVTARIALAGLPVHRRAASAQAQDALTRTILDTESRLRARLGVVVHDIAAGRRWEHRAHELFPMCSTFKALAAAAVLARADHGEVDLARRIAFRADDLVTHSPVTRDRVGGEGMTVAELCEATMATSDNTAGNLVLRAAGGPEGLTRFLRSIGDSVSRLDRWETSLNEATPGDPRDTTSPAAITSTLRTLVLGDALSAPSRERLTGWLLGNRVSDPKLKAGLPRDWRVGDRTGAGGFGTNNVAGVVWPPGLGPILVGVFVTETSSPVAESNAGMARIARAMRAAVAA